MQHFPPKHIRLKIYKRMLHIMERGSTESPIGILIGIIKNTSLPTTIFSYVEIHDTLKGLQIILNWFTDNTTEKTIKRMKRIIKKMQ